MEIDYLNEWKESINKNKKSQETVAHKFGCSIDNMSSNTSYNKVIVEVLHSYSEYYAKYGAFPINVLSPESRRYLKNNKNGLTHAQKLQVYVANATEDLTPVIALTKELRDNNISAEMNLTGRSLKAQFKYADKII